MGDYVSNFCSSIILVKDFDRFEALLNLLGFSLEGNGEDYSYGYSEHDGERGISLFGYCSIPNLTYTCPFGQDGCSDNTKEICWFSEENSKGELYCTVEEDGFEYELSEIIQDHVKPGCLVRLTESGHEKLRYVGAYCAMITSEGVEHVNVSSSPNEYYRVPDKVD